MNRKILGLILIISVVLIVCSEEKVVCNKFNIKTKLQNQTVQVSLDTDLPKNTVIMVTVSRRYKEKGNNSNYAIEYFSQRSTVEKWVTTQSVAVDDLKWETALKIKQKKMKKLGIGFEVDSISNKINVSIIVPINQTSKKFGKDNANLSGKMVKTSGLRTISGEISILYPLKK